jgi:hypothetical protein
MNQKILISCLVLFTVICLVLCVLCVISAAIMIWRIGEGSDVSLFQNTPVTTSTPTTTNINPLSLNQTTEIDPQTAAQMDQIEAQVIQERGLQPNGTFTRALLSEEQLRQRVLDDFLEDYTAEESQEDAISLSAIGLLEPSFDLYSFYIDLLSEQIAGFYDQETKQMVVVQGEGFNGPERLTYAHEYTHALQDQNYDIENGLNYNDDACEADSESCAGIQALLEGDASLSELNWFFENATDQDKSDIFEFYDSYESPILDSAPAFISQDFLFPYEAGLEFVQYLYDRGGWEAVNQAYSNPPVSTEQVLHPEDYPEDRPIPVTLPDFTPLLGAGWEHIDSDVMGEWYTYLILAQGRDENARLRESKAEKAAEGWEGDAFVVYYQAEKEDTLMVLYSLWESPKEAEEFASAFQDYATARFGNPTPSQNQHTTWESIEGTHTLHLEGDRTAWILAPEGSIAESVWTAIQNQSP